MQKMNSLRPQDTTSAERQTSWVMFVCLYVELIPSSDKPRNISFFIISWTRWLIGLQSQMKHCWVRLKCEIGQTSVAQWMGSRVTVFSSVTWGVSTWIHLHRVPSQRRNSEEKSVLPFSNFLLLSDQRSQLAGETPERSHSWVWTVTEATTHHRQIIDHPHKRLPPAPPSSLALALLILFFIFVFFKYRMCLQGREWEMNGN